MAIEIKDSTGSGHGVKVNENHRIFTHSIVEFETESATDIGNSYNINTGLVAYTGTSDSAVIYLKNNQEETLVVSGIAIGMFDISATTTDKPFLTLIRNPDGGDIISDATPVAFNQNRNFGSSKTLTADVFKGKDGGTITGGDNVALFLLNSGARSFFPIDWEIPKGNSIGAKVDLNTSGGANMYFAFICHLKDPKEQ